MNMFARFDENLAMALQDIKKTKRYGRTHGRTDGQRENSIPTTNKVCGGYNYRFGTRKLRDRYRLKRQVRQGCFLSLILNYLIR